MSAGRSTDRGRRRRARTEGARARQSGGHFERAVAPEKFASVRGPLRLPSGEVRKRDSRAEGGVPRIAGEQGTGLWIEFGQDERRRGAARSAEHPFGVGGD